MNTQLLKRKEEQAGSFIKANISTIERVLMVAAGGYLLYNALSKKNKSLSKTSAGGAMLLRGLTGYCPVYNAISGSEEKSTDTSSNVNIRVKQLINKPVEEVYNFWRNIENLPKFMSHLESVKVINNTNSEWTAKGPAGIGSLSWSAEIVREVTNSVIGWQSLEDATIYNAGKVTFTPQGDDTEIDIVITYHAPLGTAGESAAHFLNPYFKSLVKKDVESFKTYIENEN